MKPNKKMTAVILIILLSILIIITINVSAQVNNNNKDLSELADNEQAVLLNRGVVTAVINSTKSYSDIPSYSLDEIKDTDLEYTNVIRIPKCNILTVYDDINIIVKDYDYINISLSLLWKINDPVTFYQKLGMSADFGEVYLEDILTQNVRKIYTESFLIENIISDEKVFNAVITEDVYTYGDMENIDNKKNKLNKLTQSIKKQVMESDFGISITDVVIINIQFNEKVKKQIISKMIAENNKRASTEEALILRSEKEIEGEIQSIRRQILNEAYKIADDMDIQSYRNLESIFLDFFRELGFK